MDYFVLLFGFIIALLAGCVIIPNILLISHKKQLFDLPDARKVHTTPVPRLGGLSFFPVVLIAVGLTAGMSYYEQIPIQIIFSAEQYFRVLFLMVGLTLLYLVGIADDLIGVGYRYKFVVQILASSLLVISGLWLNSLEGLFGIEEIPAWIGIPFTVVVIVYITNAINLIDGVDGLASGLSCIALFVLGVAFALQHNMVYALIAFSTLGIVVPFWFYNVFGNAQRGKKLFMGDAGSLTLGYILSFLIIRYSFEDSKEMNLSASQLIFGFSTLLVPLFDVVRVVLHRIRNGKSPFLPDRNHFHHKLLNMGLRSRMVMTTILLVSLFFIVLNTLLMDKMNITFILLIDIVLWGGMHLAINFQIMKTKQNKNT